MTGDAGTTVGRFEFVEGPGGDLTFSAWGSSLEATFGAAAAALLAATLDDASSLDASERREITLEEPDLELLLLRFLNELVWLRDARGLVLRVERIRIDQGPPARLEAALAGEPIGRHVHALRSEVKAATAHGLRVARTAGGWEARATLDV